MRHARTVENVSARKICLCCVLSELSQYALRDWKHWRDVPVSGRRMQCNQWNQCIPAAMSGAEWLQLPSTQGVLFSLFLASWLKSRNIQHLHVFASFSAPSRFLRKVLMWLSSPPHKPRPHTGPSIVKAVLKARKKKTKNREAKSNATNTHLSPGLKELKATLWVSRVRHWVCHSVCNISGFKPHSSVTHNSQSHMPFLCYFHSMSSKSRNIPHSFEKDSITPQILQVIRYLSLFVCQSRAQWSYPCDRQGNL